MKEFLLLTCCILNFAVNMSAQAVNWLRVDSCSLASYNLSVKVINGSVFTEVNCDQPITYANGIFSSFQNSIVRMSSAGDYKMSAGNFQILQNFTADSAGNIYVIGKDSLIDNTYFSCCKYDSVGTLLWNFPIGSSYGVNVTQTILVSDGFVFGGTWTNHYGPGSNGYDVFIGKTDFNGNLKFLYKFDNPWYGNISKIIESDGNILISGYSSSSLTIKDSSTSITLGSFSNYFAKYTLSGNLIIAKEIPQTKSMLDADLSGNIYFGRGGTLGLFLDKFDDTCAFISSELIADGGHAIISDLKFDPFGNLYFSASFNDSLVLNSSQTFYSTSYGVSKWLLFRRNSSGINDWSLCPEGYQCYGGFDYFDDCGLAVNVFYRDSINIYSNNYYSQGGNILSRINCNLVTTIDLITESSASVFPNPSSGIFTINLKNTTVETKICVYDLLGNCLWNKDYRTEADLKIDLSSQSRGIYFIEMVSDGKRSVNKIVLQ